MEKSRAGEILNILKRLFKLPSWITSRKPFERLIITIISQNTNNKNTIKAFKRLAERFPITPEALAKASLKELAEPLKVAGLYRNKARVIKEVSRIILERFNGSLDFIHLLPLDKARKILMDMPGIGPKTADVVLLFCANKPTIPIDTHVSRVSKRLGLAPRRADYEEIRKNLQKLYKPEDYLPVHILFILFGRKYCRARNPLCENCPLNHLCPSKQLRNEV